MPGGLEVQDKGSGQDEQGARSLPGLLTFFGDILKHDLARVLTWST